MPPPGSGGVTSVDFDYSGLYIAAGGGDAVTVYSSKADWAVVAEFTGLKGVKAVRFGVDARTVAVGAADQNLRFYG